MKRITEKPEGITRFNNETIDLIRSEIETALKAVGERLNVRFDLGSITYNTVTSTAHTKLNFAAKAPDLSAIEREQEQARQEQAKRHEQAREDWNRYAKNYGLQTEWLDQEFQDGFERFKIVGLYPNRRRLIVALLRLWDNSSRIAPVAFVVEGMNRKAKIAEVIAKKTA